MTGIKTAVCIVTVNGNDISSAIMPRLINLSISDKAGSSSDTVSIDIDDKDGSVLLPSEGVSIEVSLGWKGEGVSKVFRGVVDEVKSTGSRSAGRVLSISGKGFDAQGKAKQTSEKHWDNKKLSDVFKDAAELAGIDKIKVDESLGSISRPYWAMQGESFIHFGERIAREVGGTFKISNDTAIIVKRNAGKSAGGQDLAVINAAYGDNLISWDIAPVTGRPRYNKTKARWYDTKTGTWKTEEVEIQDEGAKAEFTVRHPASDADEAKQKANSSKADSERGRGGGTITIDGNADAKPEGGVSLTGARDGIDGTYLIDAVKHELSRGSGWTTVLDLQEPKGSAGKDSRKKTSKSKKRTSRKKTPAAPTPSGGWRSPT